MSCVTDLNICVSSGEHLPLELNFIDENSDPVTPVSAKWSLTDMEGTTINGRTDIPISSPQPTDELLLEPSDTTTNSLTGSRILTIDFTYDSPQFGNGITKTNAFVFEITEVRRG